MEEKINSIIKKLNLKLIRIIKHDERYFVAIYQQKNKQVLLKINSSTKLKEKFLSEILVAKKLNRVFKKNLVPTYIKSGLIKKDYHFLLREYVSGKICGNLFGFNYKIFKPQDLKKVTQFLKNIKKVNQANIDSRPKNWYLNNLKKNKKNWSSLINQKTFHQILGFYKNNQKIVKRDLTVSHEDLFPHNIIKNKNRISIIDWGEVAVENRFWDIVTLWLNLWQKPKLQKKFIQQFIKNKEDERAAKFFVLYLSYQTGAIIKSCCQRPENQAYLKESREFLKICLKNINLIINNQFNF